MQMQMRDYFFWPMRSLQFPHGGQVCAVRRLTPAVHFKRSAIELQHEYKLSKAKRNAIELGVVELLFVGSQAFLFLKALKNCARVLSTEADELAF